MGPICHSSRNGQVQPYILPSTTFVSTWLLLPPSLPSFQEPAAPLPGEKWLFQTAGKLEAPHCRGTWAQVLLPLPGIELIEFSYRNRKVNGFKMFCETQGIDWLCKLFPKSLEGKKKKWLCVCRMGKN